MNSNQIPLRLHGRSLLGGTFAALGAPARQSALRHYSTLIIALVFLKLAAMAEFFTGIRMVWALFAGSKSDYLENLTLNLFFGDVPAGWTRPSGLNTTYLAFFSVAPTDAGGGTELTGNNYSRTAITNNNTSWAASTVGVKANAAQINGPVFSGTTPTVVAWAMFDAATSGNMLVWGDLSGADQKVYANNDQPIVPSGALTITED